jgi:hypothetical protein
MFEMYNLTMKPENAYGMGTESLESPEEPVVEEAVLPPADPKNEYTNEVTDNNAPTT